MTTEGKTLAPEAQDRVERAQRDTFSEPWTGEGDAQGWEPFASSDDQPPGPGRTLVAVELTAAQAEWLGRAAAEKGLTLAGIVSQLISKAHSEAQAA